MQKFQAKGGITTPNIELTTPSDGVIFEVASNSIPVVTTEVKSTELNVYHGGRPTTFALKTDRTKQKITAATEVNGIIFVIESQTGQTGYMDIYTSTDGGVTYSKVQSPSIQFPGSYSINYIPASKTYIIAVYGGVLYSTDLKTWALSSVPASGTEFFVGADFEGKFHFCGQSGTLHYTTNGTSWTSVTVPNVSGGFNGYRVNSNNTAYYIKGGIVYTSMNNAWTSWSPTTNALGAKLRTCRANSDGVFVCLTVGSTSKKAQIQTTTNFTTFKLVAEFDTVSDVYFNFMLRNGKTMVCTLDTKETTVISYDDGATWEKIDARQLAVTSVGTIKGKTILTNSSLDPIMLGETKRLAALVIGSTGIRTEQPQSLDAASLVRKDYVDTKIGTELKVQTDKLEAKDVALEKSLNDLAGTTFDFGEY